jgi:hypothetical protein
MLAAVAPAVPVASAWVELDIGALLFLALQATDR